MSLTLQLFFLNYRLRETLLVLLLRKKNENRFKKTGQSLLRSKSKIETELRIFMYLL